MFELVFLQTTCFRYSLFVLKVPLTSTNQPKNQPWLIDDVIFFHPVNVGASAVVMGGVGKCFRPKLIPCRGKIPLYMLSHADYVKRYCFYVVIAG